MKNLSPTALMTEMKILDRIEQAHQTEASSLDLSYTQLRQLPHEIGQLNRLTQLLLRDNQLRELPPEISQLANLKHLSLSYNQFRKLPTEVFQLTTLQQLDLHRNQLNELSSEIGQLINLKQLSISSNQLCKLPSEIGNLTELKQLSVSSNQLQELPGEIGNLNKLEFLDISKNKFEILPEQILHIRKVDYENNPLSSIPPEIKEQGWNSVREFLKQKFSQESDILYEAKLLIVGEGGAGKTSLAKKIEDDNYSLKSQEHSTEGIDIIQWSFYLNNGKEFRVNIWDFGGQEIYHATHQFFLTKRSLYILVADSRKENTDFYYWLNVVNLLSQASPILIVKNEKQNRKREINERQLRSEFLSLEKVLSTNLANNRGLSEIREAIQHYITQLDHVGTELPKNWVKVREALETDPRNYITLETYLQICKENGFTNQDYALQLSEYLHDLGVYLHFQDDDLLRKTVILKPTWGTDAVYRVLDNPQVIQNLGEFNRDTLAEIWHEEKYATMRPELLRLMMNFKLCYEIPSRPNTFIAPQLLTLNQPDYSWDTSNNLFLRYTYDFMPKGILTRLIVELHPWIEEQNCVWKTGVILSKDGARAEVIELYHRKEIQIRVSGQRRRDLLTTIRYELNKIHNSYERLKYSTLVPCNCQTCSNSSEPHFYPFAKLQERLANNKQTIECGNAPYLDVNIPILIDDISSTSDDISSSHRKRMHRQFKMRDQVFISYSHQDSEWLTQFQTHLKPFIRNKSISAWDDTQIQPGAEWRSDIDQALASASIAVLLVSPHFLASDFIAENELPPLLDASGQDGLTIIWIPISYSSYEETEIEQYQAAHPPGQPLDSLSKAEQNEAWVNICKQIKAAFNE